MTFPAQGHWWLPKTPGRRVFGTLSFSRSRGAALSLADALDDDDDEPDLIVGQTANGQFVTLLNAIRTSAPLFRLTPAFPCAYHAPLVIAGAPFDSRGEIRFSLWQARFSGLAAWANPKGLVVDSSELLLNRDSPAVRIACSAPAPKKLLSGAGGLDIALKFWPQLKSGPGRASIRHDAYFEISWTCPDF